MRHPLFVGVGTLFFGLSKGSSWAVEAVEAVEAAEAWLMLSGSLFQRIPMIPLLVSCSECFCLRPTRV